MEDVNNHIEGVPEIVLGLLEVLLCEAECLGDLLAKLERKVGLMSDIDGTG